MKLRWWLHLITACHMQECLRKVSIVIPDSFVTVGERPEQTFDVGILNLSARLPGETRDCINWTLLIHKICSCEISFKKNKIILLRIEVMVYIARDSHREGIYWREEGGVEFEIVCHLKIYLIPLLFSAKDGRKIVLLQLMMRAFSSTLKGWNNG